MTNPPLVTVLSTNRSSTGTWSRSWWANTCFRCRAPPCGHDDCVLPHRATSSPLSDPQRTSTSVGWSARQTDRQITGGFPPGGTAPRGGRPDRRPCMAAPFTVFVPSSRVGLERSTTSLGWWWILRPPLLNPPDGGIRSAAPRKPLRIGNRPTGVGRPPAGVLGSGRNADGRRVRSHLPTSSSNCLESKRT
jgi:hypothetical protein